MLRFVLSSLRERMMSHESSTQMLVIVMVGSSPSAALVGEYTDQSTLMPPIPASPWPKVMSWVRNVEVGLVGG